LTVSGITTADKSLHPKNALSSIVSSVVPSLFKSIKYKSSNCENEF